MSSIINLQQVSKYYGTKKNPIVALKNIDLEIEAGSYCLILGRSGSGKSTLLNLMSGLDKVSTGSLHVEENNLSQAGSKQLAKYRSKIGIIFQFYNLLPNLNTLENVQMGAWAGGYKNPTVKATELLVKLGLEHRLKADVRTLSGGEKQRVAIARALINDPGIIFCDEPTGALDSASEKLVQNILQDLHQKEGKTIVMVSHNPEFEQFASRVLIMGDGELISDKTTNNTYDT